MITATQWQGQDILKLTQTQWLKILQDETMTDNNILQIIGFVYKQPNCTSTASDIADYFHVHCNQITAWNRVFSKKLYATLLLEAPVDRDGERRYWNVVFDGIPEKPKDEHGHFYWKLRPELVKAWKKYLEKKNAQVK